MVENLLNFFYRITASIDAVAQANFGFSVRKAGDFNGDGYADLLIATSIALFDGIDSYKGSFYAISGRLAPVFTTSNTIVSCTENAVPVFVDRAITVIDSNNPTIASAKISISGGFINGDILSFIDQNGITGEYDTETGTLTLTGVAV